MCWSWEVSLTFTILQVIGIIYLCIRRRYMDLYFLGIAVPVMIQECCQFVTWAWGIDDSTTEHHCNGVNLVFSRITILTILILPISVALIVLYTSNQLSRCATLYWKGLLATEIVLYLVFTIFELADDDWCVFPGPRGHLNWVNAVRSDLPTYISFPFYLLLFLTYYLLPLLSGAFVYKARWIMFVPMIYILLMFLILAIFLGTESYSVWCWSGAFIQCWAIAYVFIAAYIVEKYEESDIEQAGNRLVKFFFSGTHEHYHRFNQVSLEKRMTPHTPTDPPHTPKDPELGNERTA